LVVEELEKANPVPTPSMPTATTTGEAPAPKVERKRAESSITRRPAKMGGLKPIRSERRPAIGERRAKEIAPGVNASAAAPLESPLTDEMRSGMKTRLETLASIEKNPTTTAATKPVFLKRLGETNGWEASAMRWAKPTAASAATSKQPQDVTEPKPAT
jgi:hypothetical protein